MSKLIDQDAAKDAYEDIRNDTTENTWTTLVYDGKKIATGNSGTDYSGFLEQLTDDNRVYGFVRFETGDEMSRRAKFAFITWIGPSVGVLKKAAVSTDKAFVKEVWTNFGKEILADDRNDIKQDKVQKALEAASGANYGTGK